MAKTNTEAAATENNRRSRTKSDYLVQKQTSSDPLVFVDIDGRTAEDPTPSFKDTASAVKYIRDESLVGTFRVVAVKTTIVAKKVEISTTTLTQL